MEIAFAPASLDDIPDLIAVQDLAFAEDMARYIECPSYGESPQAMARMIGEAIVYKILLDGRMVGDIIVRRREAGCYYLRTLSVIPELQGQGIGSAAVAFLEAEFPDATRWQLTTPEGTARNRHFYEKLGYREVGRVPRSKVLTLIEYDKVIRE